MAGGQPDCRAALTREPIDVTAMTRDVEEARVGAVAAFVGMVRLEENERGAPLVALEYTAHESMALREMQTLVEQASRRRELHAVRVVHRLGVLRIGEASVAVVVSAPHRAAALDACRELIEGIKANVPIFKLDRWQDGTTEWVDGI